MTSKVIVTHVRPPIATTAYDWCAYHEGEEETGHYGYGSTAAEAIDDLARLDQERAEASEEQTLEYFNRYIAGDR